MIHPLDALAAKCLKLLAQPDPPLSLREAAACFAASNNCLDPQLLAAILHPAVIHSSQWVQPAIRLRGRAAVLKHFRQAYGIAGASPQSHYRTQLVTVGDGNVGVLVNRAVKQSTSALVLFTMQDGLVSYMQVTKRFSMSELTLSGIFPPEG